MPMCAGFCQIRSGLNAQHPPVSADCQRLRDGHKLQLLAALFIPLALAPSFARVCCGPTHGAAAKRTMQNAEPKMVMQLKGHLGGVHDADTLALHGVQPRRRGIQHHIHKAIVQQVDLIHVQDAAVGLGLRNGEGIGPLVTRFDEISWLCESARRSSSRFTSSTYG